MPEGARLPSATRPLSLDNTDNKIINLLVNQPLAEYSQNVVHSCQQGSIPGRSLGKQVISADSFMLAAAMDGRTQAGALFLDIEAAYPSVSHDWIRSVIAKHSIPEPIKWLLLLNLIKCKATIGFAGAVWRSINIESGIKQGNPSASTLFVIIMDPVLRYFMHKMEIQRPIILSYVDDLMILLKNLFRDIILLQLLLTDMTSATGLRIKISKCVLVPLFKVDLKTLKRQISAIVPSLSQMRFSWSAKYLGVFIGPEAHHVQWNGAVEEIKLRILHIRGLGFGWSSSARWYKAYVVGSLLHKSQFSGLSKDIIQYEVAGLSKLLAIPCQAIPCSVLHQSSRVGLKFDFTDLCSTARACAIRSAMTIDSQACHAALQQVEESDDRRIVFPFPDWKAHGILDFHTKMLREFQSMPAQVDPAEPRLQRQIIQILRGPCDDGPVQACISRRLRIAFWLQ